MFLVVTTSPSLSGLALVLSCLFHIRASKAFSSSPPKLDPLPPPWTPHAAWLLSPPPPITSSYSQGLIPGVQMYNFSFKLLSQLQRPCPAPQSFVLMSLPSPSQSSTCHEVLAGSAVSLLIVYSFVASFTTHQPLYIHYFLSFSTVPVSLSNKSQAMQSMNTVIMGNFIQAFKGTRKARGRMSKKKLQDIQ